MPRSTIFTNHIILKLGMLQIADTIDFCEAIQMKIAVGALPQSQSRDLPRTFLHTISINGLQTVS